MNTLQYELVVEQKNTLYARLFNPETKTSSIYSYTSDKYVPPIYIPNKLGTFKSFTTGEPILEKNYSTSYDLFKAVKGYNELNVDVYGNINRAQYYISQEFKNPLESSHEMRTWFLDIETRSVNGFAQPSNPTEEISLIQIWDSFDKTFYILSTKECKDIPKSTFGEVKFVVYDDEKSMMKSFLKLVQVKDPTVICGFNSNFFDIPYITNRLDKLKIPKNALSPIGVITSAETTTPEKITYIKFDWVGRFLLDYRELFIKYSYDKLPKYSLESVATHVLGTGKVKHDEYESLEELYLKDFNTFVQYGITDVELLIQMDESLKFIDTAKLIAYTCGVNIYDVFGTLKQWSNLMFNEAMKHNKILPIKQQYTNFNDIYVGGWVKSSPGKHNWVISFDFASLYPSNIRFINCDVDTLIKEEDLPDELRALRDKYFTYYVPSNLNIIKASNNNQEELTYFKFLLDNKESITKILKKYNVTASPNGFFFTKDRESVFAGLMGSIYANRKIEQKKLKECDAEYSLTKSEDVKKQMILHDTMQYSLKILMNSAYGSTALEYNPFSFGKGTASAITTTGRLANRMVAYKINERMKELSKSSVDISNVPYTVQADTDSNYICVDSLMSLKYPNKKPTIEEGTETCKNIAEKILSPVIKKVTDDIAELLNAYNPDVLDMELETIADSFVSVADKRYFCRYLKKGELKYKITGLSLIGRSTPVWCKEKLKPVLGLIADTDSKTLVDYIDEVKQDFNKAELIDICVVKGVSAIDYFQEGEKFYKYGDTGRKNPAPFHSRGSIIHNMLLDKHEDTTYTRIKPGDKVYILPLVVPNPFFNQNVICFTNPNSLVDYGISKYANYDVMFDKNFKKNVSLITEPIGWSLDKFIGMLDEWE